MYTYILYIYIYIYTYTHNFRTRIFRAIFRPLRTVANLVVASFAIKISGSGRWTNTKLDRVTETTCFEIAKRNIDMTDCQRPPVSRLTRAEES